MKSFTKLICKSFSLALTYIVCNSSQGWSQPPPSISYVVSQNTDSNQSAISLSEKSYPDQSGFESFYPWQLAQSDRLTIQHDQPVTSIAVSPDGKTLATVNSDGRRMSSENSVKLWDLATGKELATLAGHESGTISVSFSADGKILATGGLNDGSVILWDVKTGKQIKTINSQQSGYSGYSTVHSVKISPDGKTLALLIEPLNCSTETDICHLISFSNQIELFDVATGEIKDSFLGTNPGDMAFAPDGKILAILHSDGVIKLWNLTTNEQPETFYLIKGWAVSIDFSPDGKKLAMGGDELKIRDMVNQGELRQVGSHQENVVLVKFSPDGKILATAGKNGTVRVWDTTSYKELASFRGHKNRIVSLEFSLDSKTLVTASADKTVKLWNISSFS